MTRNLTLMRLLGAVAAERSRQDAKFGPQDYPLKSDEGASLTGRSYLAWTQMFKAYNDAAIDLGTRTGDAVLLEEVYEAFTAPDNASTVEELVQVAAVALLLAEMVVRRDPSALPPSAADRPAPTELGDIIERKRREIQPAPRDGELLPMTEENSPLLVRVLGADGFAILAARINNRESILEPGLKPRERMVHLFGPLEHYSNIQEPGALVRHVWNGADRLHGICRCGEDKDNAVHIPEGGHAVVPEGYSMAAEPVVHCGGHTELNGELATRMDGRCSLCGLPVLQEVVDDDNA